MHNHFWSTKSPLARPLALEGKTSQKTTASPGERRNQLYTISSVSLMGHTSNFGCGHSPHWGTAPAPGFSANRVVCHSSCDLSPACQKLLMHSGGCHIFGNVLERLDEASRTSLSSLEATYLAEVLPSKDRNRIRLVAKLQEPSLGV